MDAKKKKTVILASSIGVLALGGFGWWWFYGRKKAKKLGTKEDFQRTLQASLRPSAGLMIKNVREGVEPRFQPQPKATA